MRGASSCKSGHPALKRRRHAESSLVGQRPTASARARTSARHANFIHRSKSGSRARYDVTRNPSEQVLHMSPPDLERAARQLLARTSLAIPGFLCALLRGVRVITAKPSFALTMGAFCLRNRGARAFGAARSPINCAARTSAKHESFRMACAPCHRRSYSHDAELLCWSAEWKQDWFRSSAKSDARQCPSASQRQPAGSKISPAQHVV